MSCPDCEIVHSEEECRRYRAARLFWYRGDSSLLLGHSEVIWDSWLGSYTGLTYSWGWTGLASVSMEEKLDKVYRDPSAYIWTPLSGGEVKDYYSGELLAIKGVDHA